MEPKRVPKGKREPWILRFCCLRAPKAAPMVVHGGQRGLENESCSIFYPFLDKLLVNPYWASNAIVTSQNKARWSLQFESESTYSLVSMLLSNKFGPRKRQFIAIVNIRHHAPCNLHEIITVIHRTESFGNVHLNALIMTT